ncbi:ATP-dependent endonuclease [Rhizobium sp. N122]|uniref:ATP-dependent nuclease n=1 Tax=Rhizobium sp. N122 TaxID=1764272 RepID=UPI000B5AAA12|nr:AAA family ATPase [Rhizobium sp. N122]OWV65230.1 ATP-dependent endonuclease [Rhizobium sp. N122]
MPIRVDTLRIAGLRGLQNIEVDLPPITVLIGTNNSGKTSVIKALHLALGDYSRYLTTEDFHIDATDARSLRIVVDVRTVPVDPTGKRLKTFEPEWIQEFEDTIRADADGNQFQATRTVARPDPIKGGFVVDRYLHDLWPSFGDWMSEGAAPRTRHNRRYDIVPFISIDAQRDIHQELNEKASFVGRILSSIQYGAEDVSRLESLIADLNREAVDKSAPLTLLKSHLDSLRDSFGGTGSAEVTPFPKKIRDLSRRFSVNFGSSATTSFSMEYHGMGTRSWASMLAVKAFSDMQAQRHRDEASPFHPVIAAEEPEAHLHPNAQRALYAQLSNSVGQVVISTHSPYLAAMCGLDSLRCIASPGGRKECRQLIRGLDAEELSVLQREVMRNRGEILFARAAIVFEGLTEEQIFPAMFEKYFGAPSFAKGVTLIGVGGRHYSPFVKMAASFGIPIYVVSDNEAITRTSVDAQLGKIAPETGLVLNDSNYGISYLGEGNDIEAELVSVLGLREEAVAALTEAETRGTDNERWREAKMAELKALGDDDLIKRMRGAKTSYSASFATLLEKNSRNLSNEQLIPLAVRQAFEKIAQWLN